MDTHTHTYTHTYTHTHTNPLQLHGLHLSHITHSSDCIHNGRWILVTCWILITYTPRSSYNLFLFKVITTTFLEYYSRRLSLVLMHSPTFTHPPSPIDYSWPTSHSTHQSHPALLHTGTHSPWGSLKPFTSVATCASLLQIVVVVVVFVVVVMLLVMLVVVVVRSTHSTSH